MKLLKGLLLQNTNFRRAVREARKVQKETERKTRWKETYFTREVC